VIFSNWKIKALSAQKKLADVLKEEVLNSLPEKITLNKNTNLIKI
jgi:hypothetical protein